MHTINKPSLSAEDVADVLRSHARRVNDTLWALDSARSMLRKANAGYRASASLGDGVWDLQTYQLRLEAATVAANNLIHELKLSADTPEITSLQRTLDRALGSDRPQTQAVDFQSA